MSYQFCGIVNLEALILKIDVSIATGVKNADMKKLITDCIDSYILHLYSKFEINSLNLSKSRA